MSSFSFVAATICLLSIIPFSDGCQRTECPCAIEVNPGNAMMTRIDTDTACNPTFKCDAKASSYYLEMILPVTGEKGIAKLITKGTALEYNAGSDFGLTCNRTDNQWYVTAWPLTYSYTLESTNTAFTPAAGMKVDNIHCL